MKPTIIVATPATHLPQLANDESHGSNVLKGDSLGMISFGVNSEIFQGLGVKSWGYEYLTVYSDDLYIFTTSWTNFKLEKEFASAWEAWLSHYYPMNS